jgi:hypothetical protein
MRGIISSTLLCLYAALQLTGGYGQAAEGTLSSTATEERSQPRGSLSPATFYDLSGGDIDVSYSTTGIAGKPSLTYVDDEETRTFSGDQLKRAQTEFGEVVSVFLKQGREGGGKIFTLIVPRVNVTPSETARVRTHGVLSRQRILVPTPHGQEITNKVISLTGTASLRVF